MSKLTSSEKKTKQNRKKCNQILTLITAPTLAKEQEPNNVHSPKANEDEAGLWLRAETSSLSSWLLAQLWARFNASPIKLAYFSTLHVAFHVLKTSTW